MDRESEPTDLRGQSVAAVSESVEAVLPISARFLPGMLHVSPRKI